MVIFSMAVLSSCGQERQQEAKEALERILVRAESVLEEREEVEEEVEAVKTEKEEDAEAVNYRNKRFEYLGS